MPLVQSIQDSRFRGNDKLWAWTAAFARMTYPLCHPRAGGDLSENDTIVVIAIEGIRAQL